MTSEQKVTFNQVVEDYFQKLDLYTNAITGVHGKNHPEVFEVRELFEIVNSKVKETATNKINLDEEFTQLRKITNNYMIPDDVCETYAGVYEMLFEIESAYHTKKGEIDYAKSNN